MSDPNNQEPPEGFGADELNERLKTQMAGHSFAPPTLLDGVKTQKQNKERYHMKYYEIEVTATRMVCVKAADEEDAKDRACDEYMEWRTVEAEVEDEFDEVKDAEHIEDYKKQGELLTVKYVG